VYLPAVRHLPNDENPILDLNLKNSETYIIFKRMLEDVMSIVITVQGVGVNPKMPILDFVKRFKIECDKLKISLEKVGARGPGKESILCIEHIQHLYEILERT